MIIRPPARTQGQGPETGRRAPGIDAAGISLLVAIAFVTRFFFLYRNGMGEPDSMVMASGMASMLSPGARFSDWILYGRELSPGFYYIFRYVYPIFFDGPEHVIPFLNWSGLISSSLVVWPGYTILRKNFGPAAAAGCISLFIFSPIVWELGTYFHPVTTAFLFFLCAWICWDRISASRQGIFFFLLTSVLATAAVIIRTEVIMLVPALFSAVVLGKRKRSGVLLLIPILAIAAVSYLLLVRSIQGEGSGGGAGTGRFVRSFFDMYRTTVSIPGILKTAVWATFGIGTGSIILAAQGMITEKGRSGNKTVTLRKLLPACVWILPTLLMWLLWPVPVIRHFFLVIPALCWIVAETLFKPRSARRIYAVVAAAVVFNLALPEILYRSYNRANPEGMKEPHGTFFYYHDRVNERIQRFGRMETALLDYLAEKDTGRPFERRKRILVPVNWESYGYITYSMAGTMRLEKKEESRYSDNLSLHSYTIDDSEILVVEAGGFNAGDLTPEMVSLLEMKAGEGYSVLLASEAASSGAAPSLPNGAVRTY